MSSLALAKKRTLRRRGEAGAVMFIVSMMVTVLAAVGMFALAASATEAKTAGNERQNSQTHYLAEYGILAFARESESGKVQSIVSLMKSNPDSCVTLPLPSSSYVPAGKESDLTKGCYRFTPAQFQQMGSWSTSMATAYGGTAPYTPSTALPGSLGPVPMSPAFFVEVTDAQIRDVAGFSGDCHFVVMTGTSFGLTQPQAGAALNIAYGAVGQELQRARYVAGPLCNKQ